MKIAPILLCVTSLSVAYGQTNASNQLAPTDTAAPPDNLIVKILRPLGPYERKPITVELRLKEYEDDTFGPFALFKEASAAAMKQGLDIPREWGQGWGAYGERFADDIAFNGVHHSIEFGIASLLHEDNRYFASGKTTTKGRTLHALMSPFITHYADGAAGFSISNATGVVGAAFLTRTWQPGSEQSAGAMGRRVAFSFLGTAASNTFREFVPDLIRKIQKR